VIDPIRSHTLWGLDPIQLHDRFWAARGVQVVRQGQPTEVVEHAELYLLTDAHCLSIFRLQQIVETLSWLRPRMLFVRLHNTRDQGYRERIVTDQDDRFVGFERAYGAADWRLGRVALTPSRELAVFWQQTADPRDGWKHLRRHIDPNQRTTLSVEGHVFDSGEAQEVMEFIRELVTVWKRPDSTIPRARKVNDQAWADAADANHAATRFVGPVWVGSGRKLDDVPSVVGPTVLWDAPESRPRVDKLQWNNIEPTDVLIGPVKVRTLTSFQRGLKRLFDIAFASAAIFVSLPLYPLIMYVIWKEDGRPFFFGHTRESMGGREFPCYKFRTMFNNSEEIKQKLQAQNQADGPQFYIKDDPRITKVGKLLRKTNLDELPQFWNVLLGHMSIVGPRPSPYKENQYCPPWREARLSVRPGVTGLWQVMRSRESGKDFQEWIRYDIEYVENLSWRMDMFILWRTIRMVLLGKK
jgi:lipopolysaccharide/colanic/teichoic acid biosynthesis glycosyltransferase